LIREDSIFGLVTRAGGAKKQIVDCGIAQLLNDMPSTMQVQDIAAMFDGVSQGREKKMLAHCVKIIKPRLPAPHHHALAHARR
jgi:hypothetical protein